MIWLSWRQQRLETLITAAILVLLAAVFIPLGIHLADVFSHEHLARCATRQTLACSFAVGNFDLNAGFFGALLNSGWLNLVPGLIGVALAAPLLLDLENGTTRLAWTQSVTRRRWLATKGALAVATALFAGAAFSLLFTWYQRPYDRLNGHWNRFDFEGIVPLAYVVAAFGLALAVGLLVRRSAAALVVAFGLYMGARLFVESWLRRRFATPLSATFGEDASGPNLSRDWIVREGPSDRAGRFFSGNPAALQSCVRPAPSHPIVPKDGKPHPLGGGLDPTCMKRLGAGFNHDLYQPASRFWEFQGIEFALFTGLAAILVAFAAWRILRTD